MDWMRVIQAGYVGAIIAVLVALMRKKNWIGRVGAVILSLVAIAAWNFADFYSLKQTAEKNYEQKIDEALQNWPIYKVIEVNDPQAFAKIRAQMIAMRKEGKTEQQFIDELQPNIQALQRKLLQLTPDAEVIAMMKVNIEQMAEIQKKSDDACFRFIFPAVKGGINTVSYLSREFLEKRMNVDSVMMRSAYGPQKHIITEEEQQNALKDMQLVAQEMISKYREDFAIMDEPYKGLGKEKIACELVQDVWNTVLSLPESQAAGVIRLVMAETN